MNDVTLPSSGQDQMIRKFLQKYSDQPKTPQFLQDVLNDVGNYFNGDRAYLFELDTERNHASNTYEWCREGVHPEIQNLQNIPLDDFKCWFQRFEETSDFYISTLTDGYGPESKTYQILQPKGIESLMAAPILVDHTIMGFLGVDNPGRNHGDLLFLSVAASTCYSAITCQRRLAQLEEQSHQELTNRIRIIQSMSEIYTSVYYIDLETGDFTELASLSDVHTQIGASGNAQERLNYFCRNMVTPDFTEALLGFVDLSTLHARMGNQKIISMEYCSSVFTVSDSGNSPKWGQCSFIEGDRSPDGTLCHVIFATQSIHDAKIQELEAQRKLQATNAELTALLATEKQRTSIINALSSVFYALYYIDLDHNSLQELISQENRHHSYSEKVDAQQFLQHMISNSVADAYQPILQNFTNLKTLAHHIGDRSIILQEYPARSGGWTRSSFIPVVRDEDGIPRQVLFALRWITSEKEALESQDNLIQALAIPYENIYTVNADTGEAICYRMGQTMSDRYGQKFAIGDYAENIGYYIENDVLQDDRHLFRNVRTVASVNALLDEKKSYSFNYRVNRNDTPEYFQCQYVKPRVDRNEFVLGFKNINDEKQQELAQQRAVESALAEVETINTALREEMAVANALSQEYHSLFKIDGQTGNISLYRTDGVGIDTGILLHMMELGSYEAVLSRYIDHFVVPEDQERIREATRLQRLMERVPDDGLYKMGYRRNMDGVILYYEMNAAKTIDENGTITFILGIRDVNDEMQQHLRQAQEMEAQSEIIEGLGSEYYSVLLVDPETDTVTTYRAEDEDGQAIADHFHRHNGCWSKGLHSYAEELVSDNSRQEFMEKLSLDHIRNDGKDYSFTYEKLTGQGIMYLQARVAFVHEQAGGIAVVVGTRNVDDLIKKERQQEMALKAAFDAAEAANKAKTDFLSNMSHDIRTPMNGIIGMTAIAAAHIDDRERVQDSLQKITLASKHLLSLINEVLDMSKIESGKVDLVEEEFNLSDLIENLLTMTSSQLEEHHHALSVNLNGVTHEEVIGDSLRIQKVFTNLMSNAVKFTPDGGKISLTISERPSYQAKVSCYEFVFADNGIGMSEEFLKHIFDPFARAENSRVNKIQGTGLGMPISRNIVRMMGGDIKVESQEGVGSKFTVTMYLKLQEVPQKTSYDKLIDLPVLVADDDAASLESCCAMLYDFGMKPEGVSTGRQAVDAVILHHQQHQDYFACILDWKMPDLDGIAATRAIRKAVGQEVPIIIISAYDWSDMETEARAAGADAFISKPLFRSRLEKTFRSLMGDDEPSVQAEPLVSLDALDFTGRRLLLVEDNDLNAEIAEEILSMTGMDVERACDGLEAVDRITVCPDGYFDMVLMDIQMPRMNGYDATRVIRSMDRGYCKQVPIIAMTANAFAEDVQAAKTVGMNEHIAKPLDLNVLAKTLSRWLL